LKRICLAHVSAELHDNICQQILLILKQNKDEQLKVQLEKLLNDVRSLSHHSYPTHLSDLGLVKSLSLLASECSKAGFNLALVAEEEKEDGLSEFQKLQIFRIIQELINNTIKHTQAAKAIITINLGNKELKYRDFQEESALDITPGFGLNNIFARCKALGATYEYEFRQGFVFSVKW
jgi:signal transduction histidine kinase